MKYLYLLFVWMTFAVGIVCGKVYFSKTITGTKEVNTCEGICYPKNFDLMEFCKGFYNSVLEEERIILRERMTEEHWHYEQGFRDGRMYEK